MTPAELDAITEAVGLVLEGKLQQIRTEMRAEFGVTVREYVAALPPPDLQPIAECAAALIPKPKDGKDADTGLIVEEAVNRVSERALAHIQSLVDALPKPENGKDGLPGKDGVDGAPGRDGLDGKDGAEGPAGKDGRDGVDGVDGAPGRDGLDGKDGRSIDPAEVQAMIDAGIKLRFADWAVDQERRAHDVFQRAIENMPKPKDGQDALQLEDFGVQHDGDGNVTFTFKRGELERSFTIRLPRFRDAGVYREGQQYREGDGVTFGGDYWIARKDGVTQKPATGDEWRLAIRKGRNGRDGVIKDKPEGPIKL